MKYLLVLLLLFGSYKYFTSKVTVTVTDNRKSTTRAESTAEDRDFVTKSPKVKTLSSAKKMKFKGCELTAKKAYSLEAMYLTKLNRSGAIAEVSPMDLTLGWKTMSNPQRLENLDFRDGTFYYCDQLVKKWDFEKDYDSLAIIPKNEKILKSLNSLKKRALIKVKGYLVNVSKNGSFILADGKKKAEMFYVTAVEVI